MTRKHENGTPVSRMELFAELRALRWEMRAWIVGALVLGEFGPEFISLLKNGGQEIKTAASCVARACGL